MNRSLEKAMGEFSKTKPGFLKRLYLADTGFKPLDFFSDFVYNRYRSIRKLYATVNRFFYWGWKLRNNYDWDGYCVYEMLALKLKRMEVEMKKHGNCMWNSEPDSEEYQLMRRLERAAELAHKLNETDTLGYFPELLEAHRKKWGEIRFVDTEEKLSNGMTGFRVKRDGVKTEEDEKLCRQEHREIMDKQYAAREADKAEFFKILREDLENFWD